MAKFQCFGLPNLTISYIPNGEGDLLLDVRDWLAISVRDGGLCNQMHYLDVMFHSNWKTSNHDIYYGSRHSDLLLGKNLKEVW